MANKYHTGSGSTHTASTLDAVRPLMPSTSSFLDAAYAARRALQSARSQKAGSNAAERMIVQLAGLSDCIQELASTGLLHVKVNAASLQTSSRFADGAWVSTTRVVRLPPRCCNDVKLPVVLCSSVMNALVVMDAVERDSDHELIEMREMAEMLATEWPDDTQSDETTIAFYEAMGRAWVGSSPNIPSSMDSLAHILTERLRGAVCALNSCGIAKESCSGDFSNAMELARSALTHIAAFKPVEVSGSLE